MRGDSELMVRYSSRLGPTAMYVTNTAVLGVMPQAATALSRAAYIELCGDTYRDYDAP